MPTAASETPTDARRSWTSWLAPDLRMLGAILVVIYGLTRGAAPVRFFVDSDPAWHIVVGDWIRAHHAIPRVDWMSFVTAGRPWHAWEWLSELVMSLVHSWAGLPGVAAFFMAVIGLAFWLWIHLQRTLGASPIFACLLAAPLVTATQIHWIARPHLIGWVFTLLVFILLERGGRRFGPWQALFWTGFFSLWANMHASFPLGLQFTGAYMVGALAQPFLWKDSDRAECFRRARWYGLATLCGSIGSLLNPYGIQLHLHIVNFLLHPEAVKGVGEWLQPDLFRVEAGQLAVAVLVAALGCLLSFRIRRLDWMLIGLAVVLTALKVVRGIPMVGLVGVPIFAAALTQWIRSRAPRAAWARWFMDLSEDIQHYDLSFRGVLPGLLLAGYLVSWAYNPFNQQSIGWNPVRFPETAWRYLDKLPDNVRIYATDIHSGYLTYRLHGHKQIFLDSRSDFYGAALFRQVAQIWITAPGWEQVFDQYHFTHALVYPRAPIAAALRARGWQVVYQDRIFQVLAPQGFDGNAGR